MKQQLASILTKAIEEQNLYLDQPVDLSKGHETQLYSDIGNLDSLSIVTIIADMENQIFIQFEIKVKLANEQDLSTENSPFNTFGSMIDFIEDKIKIEKINKSNAA